MGLFDWKKIEEKAGKFKFSQAFYGKACCSVPCCQLSTFFSYFWAERELEKSLCFNDVSVHFLIFFSNKQDFVKIEKTDSESTKTIFLLYFLAKQTCPKCNRSCLIFFSLAFSFFMYACVNWKRDIYSSPNVSFVSSAPIVLLYQGERVDSPPSMQWCWTLSAHLHCRSIVGLSFWDDHNIIVLSCGVRLLPWWSQHDGPGVMAELSETWCLDEFGVSG